MNLTGKKTPFLNWLPDESFYSLCSRQHCFSGDQSTEETLSLLFGDIAKSFAHDFPNNLNLLNKGAMIAWGSPEQIICEHTISPIFFPFQSSEHVQALKDALLGPQLGSCKYKLGLVTGRFGGAHPLKACVKCMTADRSVYGTTYWHLSHQLPGVITCPIHGLLLMESTENRQWSRSFRWLLPDEPVLAEMGQATTDRSTLTALQTISNSSVALYRLGINSQFDLSKVVQVYKEAFSNLGTSKKACVAAVDRFAEYCSVLEPFPPFSALPRDRQHAIGFISQMTRKPRGYCHPLKHLVLISWLFGRLESFVDAYQQLIKRQEIPKVRNPQSLRLSQTIDERLPKAERKMGAPRPKKIFNDLKKKILNALLNGSTKKETCSSFNISICTVNRLLRLNPDVEKKIINKAYLNKLEEQRNTWSATVRNHPGASAKIIKNLAPDIYAWLYRNDRSWLFSQTAALPSGRCGNHVTIDWDARDENFCALIKQVLKMPSSDLKKIRKCDIYQLVPSLFSSLEKRTRYPKTRKLLTEITK
ncbi:TnsD family Tn7-like transposition protein [Pseudomonas agarici]|uniref:TnsD family Tn7-like transposition protein n=1 Tax=Pseudomonas agarici TaxID=46677 RepID=UPI0015A150E3|nr:TnsD family Tn7-like transposition protein [Pseudomonas agarici]NWB90301.1 TniQ family protein [Pseudomonas agarici]